MQIPASFLFFYKLEMSDYNLRNILVNGLFKNAILAIRIMEDVYSGVKSLDSV